MPSGIHANVHRLEIPHTWLDRQVRWAISWLPFLLQTWFRTNLPEWFLPSKVILKRQKPLWGEEFEREKGIYAILRPVQGSVVPICYGEALCCLGDNWHTSPKRRSLILSELGGWDLNSDNCPRISIPKLEKMLQDAFQ